MFQLLNFQLRAHLNLLWKVCLFQVFSILFSVCYMLLDVRHIEISITACFIMLDTLYTVYTIHIH